MEDDEWIVFKDDEGFFNPNKLCRHFKKLINESLNFVEVPEGLNIMTTDDAPLEGAWGPVLSNVLGNSSADNNPFDLMYSETHGPATTLYITWNGGSTYSDLTISVDLTLSLEYDISKLPVQLSKLPRSVEQGLQHTGFHVVPADLTSGASPFQRLRNTFLSVLLMVSNFAIAF